MAQDCDAQPPLQERLQRFFREDFYVTRYPDVAKSGMKPLDHYVRHGWREGRRPNAWFSERLVPQDLQAREEGTAPYLVFLTHLPAMNEREFERLCSSNPTVDEGHPDCGVCAAMRDAFNGSYYRRRHAIGPEIDALAHFCAEGWRQQFDPCPDFSTAYYLTANPDVAEAQINPFAHFCKTGREEGRRGKPIDPVNRENLKALRGFRDLARDFRGLKPRLDVRAAGQLFALLMGGKSRLAASASHDDYVRNVGGVQKYIAEEAQAFIARDVDYLHFSPALPNVRWVGGDAATHLVNVRLNGEFVGTWTAQEIGDDLRQLAGKRAGVLSAVVLHSALGWNRAALQHIVCAGFAERFFLVHDYHSLCGEYRLLRNHRAPCDAPPVGSRTCALCAHGLERETHVREYRILMEAFSPQFVYPSQCARDIFEASGLHPAGSAKVVPHMRVEVADGAMKTPAPVESDQFASCPALRIAYCGHPVAHKGYFHFQEIVNQCLDMPDLEFLHFSADPVAATGVRHVRTVLRNGTPELPAKLLDERVDLVFVGSTWRETFNFVAYEALQAGAAIITLESSGNVADMVRTLGVGAVVGDWQSAVSLLRSPDLRVRVAEWRSKAMACRVVTNPERLSLGMQS